MIDKLFGFEQYKTYSQLVRSLLIKEETNTNVNKACNNSLIYNFNILDSLNDKSNINNITRQTVYNWIKQLIIPKVNYEAIENKETLYVMADEKWIHEQIRLNKLDLDEQEKKSYYVQVFCYIY